MSSGSDLLTTDLHLVSILGSVEHRDDCVVARSPHNPAFYHGNFLLLPGPPQAIEPWERRFRSLFPTDVTHCTLTWAGADVSDEVRSEALARGFNADAGVALALDGPPPIPTTPWTIRPLRVPEEIAAFADLNRQCDPGEAGASTHYAQFKERIRKTIASWMKRGALVWWGVFEQDTLIGQCGFGVFGSLGRFQAVETHPDERRRGVCSALIATVANDGFRRGCTKVLLEADKTGPAIHLYRRLGFREDGNSRSLVRESDSVYVRAEAKADAPAVRSLVRAAFSSDGEVNVIEALRDARDVISLVAVRSGAVLGHVLFTPVRVVDAGEVTKAVALGPLAVRPDRQRQGVGSRLVREGLRACRQAGHRHCFVLGDPDYYGRFGFEPASTCGATCEWDVPPTAFQALVLAQDAPAPRGRVRYAPAFRDV